jgi:hypothetical protein
VSLNTQNKAQIVINFGGLKPVTNWCERNCTDEWGWNQLEPAGADAGIYEFYFESDKDLVAFRIWQQ